MKFKVLLLALATTLVVTSGATAKNGGGNGKSHAQTAHSQSAAHGPKHQAKGHATKALKVKKAKKHEAAVAEEPSDALAPDDAVEEPSAETNPARTCKTRLEERGAEQFVSDYWTNTNGANAFGKCVSGVANGTEEETTEVPAEPGAACEAVAPAAVEATEVTVAEDDSSDTTEVPAEDEDSDTSEVPACEPLDGTGTTTPPVADGTGDTGTVTETGSDPAVPSADDALLAAARAVKAFAASL